LIWGEGAVGDQGVDVGMPMDQFAEGLDGGDQAGNLVRSAVTRHGRPVDPLAGRPAAMAP
jgi:hypothetical protein